MKRILIATVAVFVAWSIMDWLIHGVILQPSYAATPSLWRPLMELKMGVMYLAVLIAAFSFCFIYARLITPKGTGSALQFGLWYGVASGVGMGYGSYAVMPIPYFMAATWFWGHIAEAVVGGLIAAALLKEPVEAA